MWSDPQAIRELFTGDQSDLLAGEAKLGARAGPRQALGARPRRGPSTCASAGCCCRHSRGSRVAAFRTTVREVAEREGRRVASRRRDGAARPECAHSPSTSSPGRSSASRNQSGSSGFRAAFAAVLDSSTLLMLIPMLRADLGRWSPGGAASRAGSGWPTRCSTRRSAAAGRSRDLEERTDVLSLLLRAPRRGRPADERRRAARRAVHDARRRARERPQPRWRSRSICCCATRRSSRGCAARSRPATTPIWRAVMRETLRLRPVIDAAERTLTKTRRVAGWDLPPGREGLPPPSCSCSSGRSSIPSHTPSGPSASSTTSVESYAWLPFGGGHPALHRRGAGAGRDHRGAGA